MTYHLPVGYVRNDPANFMDEDTGIVWQPDVYPFAFDLARNLGRSVVVDLGCGFGRKLAPFVDEFTVVGLDMPTVLQQVDVHPLTLIAHDLDSFDPLPIDPAVSLVVCSDVIEHLRHPERLASLLAALGAPVVLSTPDRLRTHGPNNLQPLNACHAQEWSLGELVAFLADCGAEVEHVGYTRSNDAEPAEATCLVTFGGTQ